MAKRLIYLDTLAAMSEDWNRDAESMITMALSLLLVKLGLDTVTICLDDFPELLRKYELDRTYFTDEPTDSRMMRIAVTPRVPQEEKSNADRTNT